MRDLTTEELKHVYGAGSSYSAPSKGHKDGSKSKGHSKHASKSKGHSKSKGKHSYC